VSPIYKDWAHGNVADLTGLADNYAVPSSTEFVYARQRLLSSQCCNVQSCFIVTSSSEPNDCVSLRSISKKVRCLAGASCCLG
jgi:hypothetical protein